LVESAMGSMDRIAVSLFEVFEDIGLS
jgi:hypothetical protein